MKKFSLTDLLIFVISAELVGAFSALLSGGFTDIYAKLTRPPFSPPAAVFSIVWTVLYALMGISAYLVWRADTQDSRHALGVYAIQLVINFSWSIVFFRFEALLAAAIVAVLLLAAVGVMVWSFFGVNKKSAYLQLPYLAWSLFAAYLAAGTYLLNR